MKDETIRVKVTETDQSMDVVVLNKRTDHIQVVIGEGVHNVTCDLKPTRNKQAYVGNVMGREIVYQHSCEEVQADIERLNPALKKSRRF